MPRLSRSIALMALATTQAACFTWRYSPDPVPVVVQRSPRRIWVPVAADSHVVLLAPRISGDTLTGLIEGSAPGGQRLAVFAQPVVQVTRVATEQTNGGYTLRMLLAATMVLTVGAVGAAAQGGAR